MSRASQAGTGRMCLALYPAGLGSAALLFANSSFLQTSCLLFANNSHWRPACPPGRPPAMKALNLSRRAAQGRSPGLLLGKAPLFWSIPYYDYLRLHKVTSFSPAPAGPLHPPAQRPAPGAAAGAVQAVACVQRCCASAAEEGVAAVAAASTACMAERIGCRAGLG